MKTKKIEFRIPHLTKTLEFSVKIQDEIREQESNFCHIEIETA